MHKKDLNELSKVKKNIKQLRDSIRQKHRELSQGMIIEEQRFQKQYKPITEQLEKLQKPLIKVEKQEPKEEEEDEEEEVVEDEVEEQKEEEAVEKSSSSSIRDYFNSSIQRLTSSPAAETRKRSVNIYIDNFMRSTDRGNLYGVHFNPNINEWQIGNKIVKFEDDEILIDNNKSFTLTRGLLELLFKAVPDKFIFKKSDLRTYKQILELTGVHLDSLGRVKRNTSYKYKTIIEDLFPPKVKKGKSGRGIEEDMQIEMSPLKKDFVYWDDPNELCERLELLVNSKLAGHSGHDSEIASIIEELREIGVIVGGNLVL